MKIKEITLKEDYKVTKIDPTHGAELSDPNNPDFKITLPINQLQPDQADPNKFTMNAAGIPAQSPEGVAPSPTSAFAPQQPQPDGQQQQQQPNGQQPQPQPNGQQQQPDGQQSTQQLAPQQPQAGGQQPKAPKPPQVGSEVKLAEKSNAFNNSDLIKSGKNKPIGGDPTDDFVDDVVDHDFEKHAGKSSRKVIKPEPIRESEELIAMLTIAGLR